MSADDSDWSRDTALAGARAHGGIPNAGNDALVQYAFRRYRRECRSEGLLCQQPSQASGYSDENTIELVNCNGVLARYRITATRRLRRLAK